MTSNVVIQVDRLSKQYRLGEVSTGSLGHDVNRWWHRIRGKEDPYLRVTHANVRDAKSGGAHEYVWALRDLSFEIRQGEVLGIIGRNGAGKSTLLKIFSRITSPTTGEVRIKGRIASLLEVGTGFNQDLTGRENIYMNGAILGMRREEIRGKLDEIIAFSGCERYIDTPVKRYSSGMVVRLGFAVAAHLEPEILIVDEVLAVGDAEFQKKCIGKMQDVAGQGRTILFVSHNMDSIRALTKRCIVLSEGSVQVDDSTESAVARYISPPGDHRLIGKVTPVDALDLERRVLLDPLVKFSALGLAEGGQPEICSGGMLSLKIGVESQGKVEGLSFGYTIRHSSGSVVANGTSDVFALPGSGKWAIRLDLRMLELAPGSYDLALSVQRGAMTDTKYIYDILFGTGLFRVAPLRPDGAALPAWNSAWGYWLHHGGRVISVDQSWTGERG